MPAPTKEELIAQIQKYSAFYIGGVQEDAAKKLFIDILNLVGNGASAGDFIPLSGTTAGNPVTGDIEFAESDLKNLWSAGNDPGDYSSIGFDLEGVSLNFSSALGSGKILQTQYGLEVSGSGLYRGLTSLQDFTPNITDLDYTQKKYVDTKIPLSGTTVGNPVTGDIEMDGLALLSMNSSETGVIVKGGLFDDGAEGSAFLGFKINNQTYGALNSSQLLFKTNGQNVALTVDPYRISLFDIRIGSRGFSSDQDFTPNITDLDYTQKKYVDAQRPYKVYTALLTQIGTNNPIPVILENTLGAIVFTRDGTGFYTGTLANAFTQGKTLPYSFASTADNNNYIVSCERDRNDVTNNTINVSTTVLSNGVPIDISTTGYEVFIEIRVYN